MTLPVPISSDLLPASAWAELLAMNPSLAHAYATRQIFRTETEARVSVLNDLHFPTKAAKYWQSVREQCVMLEQLALLSFEWRRNELAIRQHTHAVSKTTGDTREGAQINLDECLFKRANMLTVAKDRHREIAMWEMLKAENNDGTFSTDDVDAHQLVSYATQFEIRAKIADWSAMSGGEQDNLAGQLATAQARCKALGITTQPRLNGHAL